MSTALTVADLFRSLSYGELSNLSLGMDGVGTIAEASQPQIMQHINDGLLKLYSDFVLSEKDVLIEMVGGITHYHLDPRFSESAWDMAHAPYPYIKDGLNPFTGDVLKILSVHDSLGCALPLNDAECPGSLFTPQANVLQVPLVQPGVSLSVVYQAKHAPLSHEDHTGVIHLPEVLHGALKAYVAWMVYSFMNTAESTAKAMEHRARYEELTFGVVSNDLASTSISTTNTRFGKRGWI